MTIAFKITRNTYVRVKNVEFCVPKKSNVKKVPFWGDNVYANTIRGGNLEKPRERFRYRAENLIHSHRLNEEKDSNH